MRPATTEDWALAELPSGFTAHPTNRPGNGGLGFVIHTDPACENLTTTSSVLPRTGCHACVPAETGPVIEAALTRLRDIESLLGGNYGTRQHPHLTVHNVPGGRIANRILTAVQLADPTHWGHLARTDDGDPLHTWEQTAARRLLTRFLGDADPWATEVATLRTYRRVLARHQGGRFPEPEQLPEVPGPGTSWVLTGTPSATAAVPKFDSRTEGWRLFDDTGLAPALLLGARHAVRLSESAFAVLVWNHQVPLFDDAVTLAADLDVQVDLPSLWTLVQPLPPEEARLMAEGYLAAAA